MTAPKAQTIRFLPVDEVVALDGRRAIDEGAVVKLMESIEKVGLLTPISFRLADAPDPETGEVDQCYVLVTGRHRVEAFRRLGRPEIPAIERHCTERTARLEEITENLHRADLTVLQRSEQEAEFARLWADEEADMVSRQVDAKSQPGRPEGGVRAAARKLNLTEPELRRANKIASLEPAAKDAARETGLDKNQSALLQAARETSAAAQERALRKRATKPKPSAAYRRAVESVASNQMWTAERKELKRQIDEYKFKAKDAKATQKDVQDQLSRLQQELRGLRDERDTLQCELGRVKALAGRNGEDAPSLSTLLLAYVEEDPERPDLFEATTPEEAVTNILNGRRSIVTAAKELLDHVGDDSGRAVDEIRALLFPLIR